MTHSFLLNTIFSYKNVTLVKLKKSFIHTMKVWLSIQCQLTFFLNYCYSITVPTSFSLCPPLPSPPLAPTVNPHTAVHVHGSLIHDFWLIPSFHHYLHLSPPLWQLSLCPVFPCLWFYLLISFFFVH